MKRQKNRHMELAGRIMVSSTHDCIACWRCVDSCPRQVLGKVSFLWHRHAKIVAPDRCVGCGKCAEVCPAAIFTKKQKI